MEADQAEHFARLLLQSLPQRLAHVLAVGHRAQKAGRALSAKPSVLIPAALLHDIGYAPAIAETGFHPLDGARWLQGHGEIRLASLVAHHTSARFEAKERGLEDALAEFPEERSLEADLLTYCDLTTGADGRPVTFEERVRDIEQRYGDDDPVTRALRAALPDLQALVERVEARFSTVATH